MKTKQKPTSRKRRRQGIFALVIIALILIVVSMWAYFSIIPKRLDAEDKKVFDKTSVELKKLVKKVESSNTEVKWRGGQACSRPSVKYDDSKEARCIVSYSASQESASLMAAHQVAERYEQQVKNEEAVETFQNSKAHSRDSFSLNYFSFHGIPDKIKCYISNSYENKNNRIILVSTLDCSGAARDAWFPRSDT